MSTVNELLEIAKNELDKVKPGEIFLVRDLFKEYEWNRISRSNRLLLGTIFLNFIRNVDTDVDIIEKTSSGQQKYKMKI
ncbi:single-stranded DNA-binding protein [Paraliobacillus sp. JSM ZJ581]|uniref:single-stranded DNA-binding protein n=1 Tax=Paraliobacillus sp. JSM ZJ581 TaxID=3342118 RepID=UPI0035A93D0B